MFSVLNQYIYLLMLSIWFRISGWFVSLVTKNNKRPNPIRISRVYLACFTYIESGDEIIFGHEKISLLVKASE